MVWGTVALGVGLLVLLVSWFVFYRLPPEPDMDDE
jgi:hypothetical protein